MLDARTGEVLAMANLPSYNPNNRGKLDPARTRNRAVTDLFEPGSTLKPFTVAAALEAGIVKPETVIQTAPGYLNVGNRTIHDAHPQGALTVAQVIQKSSNVGAAKMALALPAETMWTLFNHAGFGTVPDSGFPGEVSGKLRAYATWRPIEQATMAYGHGISVSLLPARARVHDICERRRARAADAGEARNARRDLARARAPDRPRGARHARAGGAARRHRAARADRRLSRGGQDRHRAQARRARVCLAQVHLFVRRLRARRRIRVSSLRS